jgi:hypothetical protein
LIRLNPEVLSVIQRSPLRRITLCGEFSQLAAAFYHSGMNYTTLGDSEKVMSPSWRLLAPLEAANGMLMFGVSTAMLFAVIQRLFQIRFSEPSKP